jgi:DNA-binding transcriptional regulator GbsR (MarR family)
MKDRSVEDGVYSIFSELAGMLGYSPIHGKIIGALIAEKGPVTLQELAKRTNYSVGMISLSLDLLEVLGVIKKIKKPGDRKLYLQLDGDLLTILKKAVTMRVRKGVESSLSDLGAKRKEVGKLRGREREYLLKTLEILERDIRRLEKYVNLLSDIKLP